MRKWLLIGVFVAGCASPDGDGRVDNSCKCKEVRFADTAWGSVTVGVEGNDLLVTLPVKGNVTCTGGQATDNCGAMLTVNARGFSLAPDPEANSEPGRFALSAGCDKTEGSEFNEAYVFKATYPSGVDNSKVKGNVRLNVRLFGCGESAARRVPTIEIIDSKLDDARSDFDDDGIKNGMEEDGQRWKPNPR